MVDLLLYSRTLRPPSSTLFPYTTLFRSRRGQVRARTGVDLLWPRQFVRRGCGRGAPKPLYWRILGGCSGPGCARAHEVLRSEEHTSELQSRRDLVCRLLLEKKNATAIVA